jgi:hypothetical protein
VHDALVTLFRTRPTLATELLRDALHAPVPGHDDDAVEIAKAALTAVSGLNDAASGEGDLPQ